MMDNWLYNLGQMGGLPTQMDAPPAGPNLSGFQLGSSPMVPIAAPQGFQSPLHQALYTSLMGAPPMSAVPGLLGLAPQQAPPAMGLLAQPDTEALHRSWLAKMLTSGGSDNGDSGSNSGVGGSATDGSGGSAAAGTSGGPGDSGDGSGTY